MKKVIHLTLLNLLAVSCLAQTGRVVENLQFESKILGTDVGFSVYLPPDYETSDRSYPVVYLLHGYTDDETAWVQFGEVDYAANEGIGAGKIPPMIIAMPDGGVSFYINDYQGKVRWEDMFTQEFIPYFEEKYRVRRKKEFRGIAGLSMGGYGATILSMRHPDLFAACAALSAAYRSDEEVVGLSDQEYARVYGRLFGENLSGDDRLTDHWRNYSVLHLAKTLPEEQLKSVRWYVDCGDDDFLYEGNALFHIAMRERDIPHEFRVRDGAHTWSYWRTGIKEGLRFIGESFHR